MTDEIASLFPSGEFTAFDFTRPEYAEPPLAGSPLIGLHSLCGKVTLSNALCCDVQLLESDGAVALAGKSAGGQGLTGSAPLVSQPDSLLSFSYRYLDPATMQRVIWQQATGAVARLQIVQNGAFNGVALAHLPTLLGVFIAGASGGKGAGGMPQPVAVSPGVWHRVQLVLSAQPDASRLIVDGREIDTFTLSAIPATPFTLFGTVGRQVPSSPLLLGRIVATSPLPAEPVIAKIQAWLAAGYKPGGASSPAGRPEKYNPRALHPVSQVSVTTSQARVAAIINHDGSINPEKVLIADGENAIHPLASLTKIMTAIVLLDGQPEYSEKLTRLSCDPATGSGANLAEGDTLCLRDAVYNLMLPSSNVTANMVARIYGGKLLTAEGQSGYSVPQAVSRWVAQMNSRAQALGMHSARFTTPSGLGRNSASALDVLKMVAAATQYPLIMQSWRTQTHAIKVSGNAPRLEYIINTNDLLFSDPTVIGGKTGTLTPLFNLFCLAQMPDHQRLVVIALAASAKQDRATDCAAMLAAIKAQYD
ncbi:D-alanyl-D-alanine carboxypeptidase family protein [Erwinia sp. Leaf53]|uniref:D-alanyl-D-alanine carboxypeptidase family protein n=1 Tax=Erwinia sp. Leaf53 TaxID=1736225 RepID=UPI0006FBD746|nr:serine hydrolase [Erwinia sp. Leaf53]KQN56710.1 hypothetical protein ASF13_06205 [Erwinia sp. Leaf53]